MLKQKVNMNYKFTINITLCVTLHLMNILLISNKNYEYIELMVFALILLFIYNLALNSLAQEAIEDQKKLEIENLSLRKLLKEKNEIINELKEFSYRTSK